MPHRTPWRATLAVAAAAAVVAAAPAPAQEEADTTTPAYLERIQESRRLGRGVTLTREELASLPARTVGGAVDRMVRGRFRTADGVRCRPAVYWNGIEMVEPWHPRQSVAAEIRLERVLAIEVYFADRDGRLPSEYLNHRCGVIALWVQSAADGSTASTLVRLGLALVAGLVFFLAVAN